MTIRLADFIRLYQLPSGRTIYAMNAVLDALKAYDAPALVALAVAVRTAADTTRGLELGHQRQKSAPVYGAKAMALDATVDRRLSAIATIVDEYIATFGDSDNPRGVSARRIKAALFPNGVASITSLSFFEEHTTVLHMVGRLTAPDDLGGDAQTLGLEPFVVKLAEDNAAYGREIPRPDSKAPTWDQVGAARVRQHDETVRFLVKALAHFDGDDEGSAAGRSAVVGPLQRQQELLARLYRTRRVVRDVNPETGEEVTDLGLDPLAPPPGDGAMTGDGPGDFVNS